jgi:hypothetical protein
MCPALIVASPDLVQEPLVTVNDPAPVEHQTAFIQYSGSVFNSPRQHIVLQKGTECLWSFVPSCGYRLSFYRKHHTPLRQFVSTKVAAQSLKIEERKVFFTLLLEGALPQRIING